MKGKVLFVAGAAVGYVLGARAGRQRYEQIRSAAAKVWETPGIQRQVRQAQDYAARKVGEIPGAVFAGARKAVANAIARADEDSPGETQRTSGSRTASGSASSSSGSRSSSASRSSSRSGSSKSASRSGTGGTSSRKTASGSKGSASARSSTGRSGSRSTSDDEGR